MLDDKDIKKLEKLCIKISNVFTDFYILKNGYLVSLDVTKPFIIQIDEDYVHLFEELCGKFKILHLWDIKNFKKDMNNYISEVTSNTEATKVVNLLSERIDIINKCDKWESFKLSDSDEDNEKLILSLFKKNDYINFKPIDNLDGPEIILTKSLLPLVSEKNYEDLYYASKKLDSDLYAIIFDFKFTMFKLYMVHHYISID